MRTKATLWAVMFGTVAALIAVGLITVLLPIGGSKSEAKIPPEIRTALYGAERMELYSILPEMKDPQGPGTFRGYTILGKTEITDASTRGRLATALEDGTRDANVVAMCFNPHHGLRLVQGGRTIDLVICFTCRQVVVYRTEDLRKYETFLVTISPLETFTKILSDAGVPLPPMENFGEK
jgi:hypothetical protein